MTGSKDVVSDLQPPSSYLNCVTIGDNFELKVLGRGKVVISNYLTIKNVLLVESLGYNLMSVIQLARAGFASYFDEENMFVTWKSPLK